MLYVRVENKNGDMMFAPVKNDDFYIHCLKCDGMEQIEDENLKANK